jgi:hypothetical protein
MPPENRPVYVELVRDVSSWHLSEMPTHQPNVSCWGYSGTPLRVAGISPFDPTARDVAFWHEADQ